MITILPRTLAKKGQCKIRQLKLRCPGNGRFWVTNHFWSSLWVPMGTYGHLFRSQFPSTHGQFFNKIVTYQENATSELQFLRRHSWRLTLSNLTELIEVARSVRSSLKSGFWIPRFGFQIPGPGFQYLSVELKFLIPIVSGIPDSLNCIPKTQDSGFHKQKFPGFRNPDSLKWASKIVVSSIVIVAT